MIESMLNNWKRVVIVIGLITLALAPFLLKLKIYNSLEANSVRNDPTTQLVYEIQETFGVSEEVISVSIQLQDSVLDRQMLLKLRSLLWELEAIDGVQDVVGITTLQDLDSEAIELETTALIPVDAQSYDLRTLSQHPLYGKLFVSNDHKSTFALIVLEPLGFDHIKRKQILLNVEQILTNYEDWNIKLGGTGMPYMTLAANDAIERDNEIVIPIAFLVIGIFLFLIFRKLTYVIAPFLVAGISIAWVVSIMAALGIHMTNFTSLVPLVLLIICLCDAVHLVHAFDQSGVPKNSDEYKSFLINATKKVFWPCVLTSLTTIAGFLALATNGILSIRHMGFLIALGVVFALSLSFILIPIFLYVFQPELETQKENQLQRKMKNALFWVSGVVVERPKTIVFVSALILGIALVGLKSFSIDQLVWGIHKHKLEAETVNFHFEENGYGATGELDVIYYGEPGAFYDPELLETIDQIMIGALGLDYVQDYTSLSRALKHMFQVPDDQVLTPQQIQSGLLLLENEPDVFDVYQYITPDGSMYRALLFTTYGTYVQESNAMEAAGRKLAEDNLPPGITYEMTGRNILGSRLVTYVAESQLQSFLLALVVISLFMGVFFKSIRMLFLSLIPNMVPIGVAFGVLSWLGYPLNTFTSLVGCIALGLVVDDTIHFVSAYRHYCQQGMEIKEAIQLTFSSVAFPITVTSLVLSIGFLVFYFSDLATITEVGFLLSAICVLAWFADLFLLAPILLLTRTKI